MRKGWTNEEAAVVLNVRPAKVSQAMKPAFSKVARLMLADPMRTMRELFVAMEEETSKRQNSRTRDEDTCAVNELELDRRERMLTGRLDRSELFG